MAKAAAKKPVAKKATAAAKKPAAKKAGPVAKKPAPAVAKKPAAPAKKAVASAAKLTKKPVAKKAAPAAKMKHVDHINEVVADIASGAKEQAIGLQEVNSAVNQMDVSTQQNAAMVVETTVASEGLADEIQRLNSLIAQFRVREDEEAHGQSLAA